MTGTATVVETGYNPRPQQAEVHANLRRFNVLVCHRRFGKTVLAINEMIDQALRCRLPNPRYAYLAPFYRQAKQAAWDYLKMYTQNIPGRTINESELRVDFMGRRCQLLGADNYDALRGIYLDGSVLDEYAQMPPPAWSEVIRPALSDRRGWAMFIGTPKGRNAFWELYRDAEGQPDWYRAIYRASETGIIDPEELAAARRVMTEAEYDQEWECSFSAAIAGAYYAREMDQAERDGRITSVPYKGGVPVNTAWDLGIGDATAIWFFQKIGMEIRLVDYLESSGVGLDWYAARLREKPYAYGAHLYPHDAGHDQLSTGHSLAETLSGLGLRGTVLLREQHVETGIDRARKLLSQCWFDKEKCLRGVEAMRQYHAEWSEKNRNWTKKPTHDWSSHGADAFRYLAQGLDGIDAGFQATFNKKLEYPRLGLA